MCSQDMYTEARAWALPVQKALKALILKEIKGLDMQCELVYSCFIAGATC